VLTDGRTVGVPRAADPPGPADFAASNVTVVEETIDSIVYRIASVPTKQSYPRVQVRDVIHDPSMAPPELADGMAFATRGQFDEARTKVQALSKNIAAPAWAQAEASFRFAESYAKQGDAAAAERALASFVAVRARSRL